MIDVSDKFLRATTSGATVSAAVFLDDVRSGVSYSLPVEDGQVSLDNDAATRGAIDLTLANAAGDDWVPDEGNDLLAPYGNEVRAELGFDFGDGSAPERVTLGKFRIDETSVTEEGADLQIQISGQDRSSLAIDAVFEQSGEVAAGDDAADTIEELLATAYTTLPLVLAADWGNVTVSLPAVSYEEGQDRWDFCRGLAEAAGAVLFFDNLGQLCMRQFPPTSTERWTVSEGDGGALLAASKRWGREGGCNRVVVYGENSSSDPVRGVATDDVSGSPTEWGGFFGKVTFTFSSEWVSGQVQAERSAQRILDLKKGTSQQIGFTALLNPALEPYDTVKVVRGELGINELHVIDRISFPLTWDGEMTCETRLLQVT